MTSTKDGAVNESLDDYAASKSQDHEEPKIEEWQAIMNLVKSSIGSGILAMPVAFMNAGLWFGFVLMGIIGVFVVYCMHQLNNCVSFLESRQTISSEIDFGGLCEVAFLQYSSEGWRRFGRYFKTFCNANILIIQLGANCIYLTLIAQNIQHIIEGATSFRTTLFVYELWVLVTLFTYVFVRHLRGISYMTLMANALVLISMVIIFQYMLRNAIPAPNLPWIVEDKSSIPLTFGTSIFAFECITLILPVRNRMKRRQNFGGYAGVLNVGMVMVVCLFVGIGFYGYLRWGNETAIILDVLPKDNWLYNSVRIMYIVALFVSFGIIYYVPVVLIVPAIWKAMENYGIKKGGLALAVTTMAKGRILTELVFRTVLLLLIFTASVSIPYLALLISLLGSLCGCFLGLLIPPVCELGTFLPQYQAKGWRYYAFIGKNVLILAFGLAGLVSGTYASVAGIVDKFKGN